MRDELLEALSAAVDDARPIAVATVVDTAGSVPRHPGAKMLVYGDGSTLGTVGGGAVEALVRDDALDAMKRGATRIETYTLQDPDRGDPGICGGTMTIALEPYMPPHTLLVVGCGHVGRAVIELAHWLGYRTVAIDDRPELVTEEELPNADVRFAGPLVDAVQAHPITSSTSAAPKSDSSIACSTAPASFILHPHMARTTFAFVKLRGSSWWIL